MGYWQDDEWYWRLEWTDSLMPVEVVEAESLVELLVDVRLVRGKEDRRKWMPDSSGLFSVRSTYSFLQNMSVTTFESDITTALHRLWLNDVPSK
ncbi:hypothetical protein L195_g050261, partial [Trifolium pratense]